ncbi:hypothetical protein L1887_34972 [Cichorium endivia]|nr:hypothetical protein L1887_34972 [Cichorium endivia]
MLRVCLPTLSILFYTSRQPRVSLQSNQSPLFSRSTELSTSPLISCEIFVQSAWCPPVAAACLVNWEIASTFYMVKKISNDGSSDTALNMNKKEVFKLAKGFRGRAKNCIRIARERVEKALQYSYRDRRNKKRDMRSLWIERINAGTRVHGVNYGNFMHGLVKENIQINRKVLSELSMHEPYSFKALVDVSRTAFPGNRQVPATPKKEGLAILI